MKIQSKHLQSNKISNYIQESNKGKNKSDYSYEIDKIKVFAGIKQADNWLCYSICRETSEVIDFVVGSRNKVNLIRIVNKVLDLKPKKIFMMA